jgi:HK97 family phage major capsid protein
MSIEAIMKSLDSLEAKMTAFSEKAENEIKSVGDVSTETKNALDALALKQREFADEILALKQQGVEVGSQAPEIKGIGEQFVECDEYKQSLNRLIANHKGVNVGLEVKNTITNAVGNTFSQRRPDLVGGAFREFTLEELLTTIPATSMAIDYVRETPPAGFTNNAAERAEGTDKPESAIVFEPKTMHVSTVAHWLKISRQLAADNAALAAYINTRMIYGVNLRVENQLIAGDGAAPNISGFATAGNFTAHGYTNANLTGAGLLNNRFDLIGKICGDLAAADYPADVIIVNPTDWWTMRLQKEAGSGAYIMGPPSAVVAPTLFGKRVVSSNAVTADTVFVMNIAQAATFYNREAVNVQLSDSDGDNFTKNLITVRAERRCALTVERPLAVRYGDLTPA